MSTHRDIMLEHHQIEDSPPGLLAVEGLADPVIAQMVIDSPVVEAGDGRSAWQWFRLANGDLILGCWPRGETYEATEADENRP